MRGLDWFWWAAVAVALLLVAGSVFLVQQRVTAASLGEVFPADGAVLASGEVVLSASVSRLEQSGAAVEVLINGAPCPSEELLFEGDRVAVATTLADGPYTAEVVLTSDNFFAREKVQSWSFRVDTTPPMVELVTPLDLTTLDEPRTPVYAWWDEPGTATLTVNGVALPLQEEQASFTTVLDVEQGSQHIVLEVTDTVGNVYRREWQSFADFERPVIHALDWPEGVVEENELELHLEVADNFPEGLEVEVRVDAAEVLVARVEAFDTESPGGAAETGENVRASSAVTADSGHPSYKYLVSLGELAEGDHVVHVSVRDRGGHTAEHSHTFKVDSTDKFGYVNMVAGAQGKDVAELQRLLQARGFYSGERTAKLDVETQKALVAFRESKGLEPLPMLDSTAVRAMVKAIVIDRSECKLYLYDENGLVKTYGVAVGTRSWPTPVGRFRIIAMWKHPSWTPPNSSWAVGLKPVPPGPGNPLGTRWMGIDSPSVGIHGTPQPWTIGSWASHGCIRMKISDAEDLYDRVYIGTPVQIIN